LHYVLVKSRSKVPAQRGWTSLPPVSPDWEAVRRGDYNIGVLLGGDLVDVDLDDDLAVRIAPEVLPYTLTYGRQSRRRSHYLYRLDGGSIDTTKWKLPNGAMLLELRSSGAQSVVPPSIHPSGEQYEWDEYDDAVLDDLVDKVTAIDADTLRRSCSLLAFLTALAHAWLPSVRHELALATAGYLAKNGITRDDARRFVRAVAAAAGDEEVHDRIRAVEDTYTRLNRGEAVAGYSVLKDFLPPRVLAWVDDERDYAVARLKRLQEREELKRLKELEREQMRKLKELERVQKEQEREERRRLKELEREERRKLKELEQEECRKLKELQRQEKELEKELQRSIANEILTELASYVSPNHVYTEAGWYRREGNRFVYARQGRYSFASVIAAERFPDRIVDIANLRTKLHNIAPLVLKNHAGALDDFDAPPYLVNTDHGVFDLSKLAYVESDARFTYSLNVRYVEDEPRHWLEHLERVLPEPWKREYLQRLLGSALLGVVPQRMSWWYGKGRNGKSATVFVIESVLEPLVLKVDEALFDIRSAESQYRLAMMRGKRLVIVQDMTKYNARSAVLKAMLSGDTITARQIYGVPFQFRPQATLVVTSNNLPEFDSNDEGTWRRVSVLPWDVQIPEDENLPFHEFMERFESERDAIFSWMARGARKFIDAGFVFDTEESQSYVSSVRTEVDPVASFIELHCDVTGDAADVIPCSEVYERFMSWCTEEGLPIPSRHAFGREMRRYALDGKSHLQRIGGKPVKVYRGIRWQRGVDTTADEGVASVLDQL
jgi:putative DNA primase/helicase